MGAGFFLLNEHRGGCCQLGRGIEGNSSNRAELGAACLALEDTTNQQDRKPVILLSDSACFLSSSQKWTGEGKSPSMHGNPDADIMRDIVRLLRERIDHGLLTIFIKINLKPTGETPLMNKPIDGQMKEDRAITYAGPSHQIDLFFTGRTKA